jgi:ubiquinone/menaquinone biosynthesis C-methylase UbiE
MNTDPKSLKELIMGFYENHVLPRLIDAACATPPILKQREKVVPHAVGRVLEVGMGPAINIPFYDASQVEMVWGLEPSEGMRIKAAPRIAKAPFPIEWLSLPGEEIPLEDDAADTVLLTFTLCTIPDFATALAQMRRVLKPGGKLLFAEHGAAPDESTRKWQDRINPLWKRLAGGCNINREIPQAIEAAGFKIEELDTMYLPGGPKVAAFQYWGAATQL